MYDCGDLGMSGPLGGSKRYYGADATSGLTGFDIDQFGQTFGERPAAEIRTVTTLRFKRDEIAGTVEKYERMLGQARADLSHIEAALC